MNNIECPICYGQISSEDTVKLKCNHYFHRCCLIEAFKYDRIRVCPYCRSNYNPITACDGETFISGFHKKKNPNERFCIAIIGSGKRKGEICKSKI